MPLMKRIASSASGLPAKPVAKVRMALRKVHHSTTGRRPTTSAMYEPISEPIIWPALPNAPMLPIWLLDSPISRTMSGMVNEISEKSSPSKNVTSEQITSSRTWNLVKDKPCRNLATSSVAPLPACAPAECAAPIRCVLPPGCRGSAADR